MPKTRGSISYSKLAKLCFSFFETGAKEDYLIRAFNDDALDDIHKAKFQFPEIKDVKPK